MAQDPFCQNFMVAYESRYNTNVSMPINEQLMIGFGLELPAPRGPLDTDERELARRLGLHLHDALMAYERVRRLVQQSLAGHELLQRYPYPMWLLDDQRAIRFENPAAVAESNQALRVVGEGGRLRLRGSAADRRLTERVVRLSRQGHGASDSIDLRPTEADPPVWLHLSVMAPADCLGVFGARPQLLATLFDPARVSALDSFALARMFRLTPTEARVAAKLAEGLTAEQIGLSLHAAESTVRTHIRQVLAKLGARRISEVVRMLRQGEALWAQPATG